MELRARTGGPAAAGARPAHAGAHRQAGQVVDGFVGVELDALAAHVGQAVDDVGLDFEQAELEDLEQPDGASADDDGVSLDHLLSGHWGGSASEFGAERRAAPQAGPFAMAGDSMSPAIRPRGAEGGHGMPSGHSVLLPKGLRPEA